MAGRGCVYGRDLDARSRSGKSRRNEAQETGQDKQNNYQDPECEKKERRTKA